MYFDYQFNLSHPVLSVNVWIIMLGLKCLACIRRQARCKVAFAIFLGFG